MDQTDGNTTEVRRADLPDDTLEVLEAIAADLGMGAGRHYLKLEFKEGRFAIGSKEEILTRSSFAAHDAARAI